MEFRDYSEGDELSASWLNSLKRLVLGSRIKAVPPLYCDQTPTAQVLRYVGPQMAYFEITSGANPYAGKEKRPIAGGAFVDRAGGRVVTTSTDPLYERNRANNVPVGAIVIAIRDGETGAWIFDRTTCGALPATPPKTSPTPTPARTPGLSPEPAPSPLSSPDIVVQLYARRLPTSISGGPTGGGLITLRPGGPTLGDGGGGLIPQNPIDPP